MITATRGRYRSQGGNSGCKYAQRSIEGGSITLKGGLLCVDNTDTLQVESYIQNPDATLALRVKSPTSHDQLVVNGNANLGGTLLLVDKPPNFGKEMLLITSEGLNASRFDNIQGSISLFVGHLIV